MSQYASQITGDVICNLRYIDGNIVNVLDNDIIKNHPMTYSTRNFLLSNTKTKFSSVSIKGRSDKTSSQIHFKPYRNITKLTVSFWAYHVSSNFYNSSWGASVIVVGANTELGVNYYIDTNSAQQAGDMIYICNKENSISYITKYHGSNTIVGSWIHYVFQRNANSVYLYRNGSLLLSGSLSSTPTDNNIELLSILNNGTAEEYYDDIVVILNQNLFSGNFTVPNNYLTGDYTGPITKRMKIAPTFHNIPIYQDRMYLY